jgi:F-type H+-transporting ATPase subunit b
MQKFFRNFLFSAIAIALATLQPQSLAAQERGDTQTEMPSIQEAAASKSDAHATTKHERQEVNGGAEAHHGEKVLLFGKHLGPTAQFLLKLLNVLIFCGLLFWVLKGVLGAAFKARANEIEAKLAQSEKDRAEGEAQVRELEAKMAGLQAELGGIMTKAEADAEAEKQRILEAARLEAEQILSTARSEIEYQRRLAETELRELIANLAVEGAEKRIQQQMQGENVARVMDLAIEQIGGAD